MKIVWICISIFCLFSTLMPFVNNNHWTIRMFDFPHAQVTALTLGCLLAFAFFFTGEDTFSIILAGVLLLTFIYQSTVVYRYTPLKSVESLPTDKSDPSNEISLLSANVLMSNRESANLIAQIKEEDPDIVILLEVDEWWIEQVDFLKQDYPYHIEKPIDNLYGMAVYSRLEWQNPAVKYIIEDDIPSLETKVVLSSGKIVDLYVVHPQPPSPVGNEESTERDAELLIVGKKVKELQRPAIVIGDLNDVAWSHSTRLFQKISGLLDPRIGRGFYNTFHADYPFLRWPLDHVFHSEHFKLSQIKCLDHINSDHFPIYVQLQYAKEAKHEQTAPTATAEEKKEAKKKIQEGKNKH